MATIRISTVQQRLADAGITYYQQGGQIIRSIRSDRTRLNHLTPLHYSITSEYAAVAADADRVLAPHETLAARWL